MALSPACDWAVGGEANGPLDQSEMAEDCGEETDEEGTSWLSQCGMEGW